MQRFDDYSLEQAKLPGGELGAKSTSRQPLPILGNYRTIEPAGAFPGLQIS